MADFRKHDDPLAGLTARALARSTAPASPCPEASLIAAYFERSLSDAESAQHEQHFAACVRCQQQLAVLARLETASPVAAADPSQSVDPGWRRYWNWKMWVPATVALGALALWIAGTSPTPERAAAPAAQTEIAQNRAPQSAPSESAKLSTDALSRKDSPAAAKPTYAYSGSADARAKTGALAVDPKSKRDEAMTLAGRVNQAPGSLAPSVVTAQTPPPAREAPAEERALAKLEAADAAKLRDAEKKKQAAAESAVAQVAPQAPPPQAAAAPAEQERVQAQTANRAQAAAGVASQDKALSRQRTASEGDLGAFRAGERPLLGMAAYITVHAPAPSLALWRIGPGSTLEKSLDSGKTWQVQKLPARASLQAGSAASEEICWLVGRAGTVLRTTDGVKWEKLPAPAEVDLTAVEARDAQSATVVAADGRRFVTADGGHTWKPLD